MTASAFVIIGGFRGALDPHEKYQIYSKILIGLSYGITVANFNDKKTFIALPTSIGMILYSILNNLNTFDIHNFQMTLIELQNILIIVFGIISFICLLPADLYKIYYLFNNEISSTKSENSSTKINICIQFIFRISIKLCLILLIVPDFNYNENISILLLSFLIGNIFGCYFEIQNTFLQPTTLCVGVLYSFLVLLLEWSLINLKFSALIFSGKLIIIFLIGIYQTKVNLASVVKLKLISEYVIEIFILFVIFAKYFSSFVYNIIIGICIFLIAKTGLHYNNKEIHLCDSVDILSIF